MAYYWITEAQKYIQSLGFGTTRPGIDNQPQKLRIDQYGADNSFDDRPPDPRDPLRQGRCRRRRGRGGRSSTSTGTRFMSSQNFNFDPEENGAISEGFGDYWAVTVSDVVAAARRAGARAAPLRRRLGLDLLHQRAGALPASARHEPSLPTDLNGEVHHDGQIWSRALWDIRQSLGREADTIILQVTPAHGHDDADLANRTVAAALSLYGRTRGRRAPGLVNRGDPAVAISRS